ncbi:hypothetical protein GCL60_04830 [Silvanigrella paludirubra]|uniref:Uncharacterized protein n=1 Tax=Silvanigrella paludirubra TaxID=2499159 RepID=A0A6N6VXV8_9BACT|nr:hypothetical protein [Silvanigrella paludirubra]KAB8039586.1 hypothetical protein GCL60_04830 [Silvanigrella paludirubra]
MKINSFFSKYLSITDNERIYNIMREIISYNNIDIDEKMFFSSTAYYNFNIDNRVIIKERFPLKIFIPDFILENFSLHTKDQKKVIISFLKIFIKELIFLNHYFEVNKNVLNYLFNFKNYNENDFLNSQKNLNLFFQNFFKRKPKIIENIPKLITNNKQFVLGKNTISSKILSNDYSLGSYFYSFVNRIKVVIEIDSSEIVNFKVFLKIIGISGVQIIFSNNNLKNNIYKYSFIFEKNKCLGVYAIPKTNDFLYDGDFYA